MPGGHWLARMAGLGFDVHWLLTGEKAAEVNPTGDPGEVGRLRQDLAAALKRVEGLTEQLTSAVNEGVRHGRRALDLGEEVDRLRAENQALRAQATAAALGPEEGKLVVRASELLGLGGAAGLEQVLGRVVDIFGAREAARGTPPTVHDKDTVQKLEGDGGGTEESDVPSRANSSS